MKVTFAAAARGDLRDIGFYIAHDNAPRSITFVEELRDRCLALSNQAERFPVATQLRGRPLHKLTHAGYLIFYTIEPSHVEVLRIVHGSRDWSQMFEI